MEIKNLSSHYGRSNRLNGCKWWNNSGCTIKSNPMHVEEKLVKDFHITCEAFPGINRIQGPGRDAGEGFAQSGSRGAAS
jgi:hypothetical protein